MSRVSLPTRAFNDRRIRGSHLRVLAAIAMLNAGALSHKEIGAECGITGRDLRRELQELVDFEYLSIEVKDGAKSTYVIQYSGLEGGDKSSPEGKKISTPEAQMVSPDGPPPLSPLTTPIPPPPLNPPSPTVGRASRLPADWMPNAEDTAYGAEHGFAGREWDRLIDDYRDYWHARAGPGGLKLSWKKTLRVWIRKQADLRAQGNGRLQRQSPGEKLYEGAFRAAERWERGETDRESGGSAVVPLLDSRRSAGNA